MEGEILDVVVVRVLWMGLFAAVKVKRGLGRETADWTVDCATVIY